MEKPTIEQVIGYEKFRTLFKKDAPESDVKKRWDMVKGFPYKTNGRVEYYFKAKNKYPARVYVFIHAEDWRSRNRRAMALADKSPFLSRPMTENEIFEAIPDMRMLYYQYEDWDKLLNDERNNEQPEEFINELASFKEKFKLAA